VFRGSTKNLLRGNAEHRNSSEDISGDYRAGSDDCSCANFQAGQDAGVTSCEDCLAQAHLPGYVGMTAQGAPVTDDGVVAHCGSEIDGDKSTERYVRREHHGRTQDTAVADAAVCADDGGRMD
jgi:hypothetical protein